MRKIPAFILFVFVFGFSKSSTAQGNLQFNQVIFYEILYGTNQVFTVPAGKVWKIESVSASSSNCPVWLQNSAAQNIGYLFYASAAYLAPYPIWLPSTHSGFFAYNTGGCTGTRAFVSIIEFNVVP